MTVCSFCIHKALSQYLDTMKWLAYKNQEVRSKRGGRGFGALTAPLVSLCTVLAVDVEKVSPRVRYPKVLPLGKRFLAESAVHVTL
jgi:hypothetical protein